MKLPEFIIACLEVAAAWIVVGWFALTWWAHEAPEVML